MKKFLIHTILMSVIFTGFIVVTIVLLNKHVGKKAKYTLDESVEHLILGHSHPQCAYNDALIPGFRNTASGGESYFFLYYKSKLILNNPNTIKSVFIEFTNNQVERSMDEWIWGDKYLNERYPYYAPFIEKKDLQYLINKNPHFFTQAIPISIKKNALFSMANKFDYNRLGGYTPVTKSKTDSFLTVFDTLKAKIDTSISYDHISYLKKLISYFQYKNIKVFLIRSPQHKKYNGYYNESRFNELLKENFNTIPFLDFSAFPLKNEEFADLEHLNDKGATIFSTWFAQRIANSAVLKNTDPDIIENFIQEEIKLIRATHSSIN